MFTSANSFTIIGATKRVLTVFLCTKNLLYIFSLHLLHANSPSIMIIAAAATGFLPSPL